MLKCGLLMLLLYTLTGCSQDAYYGTVYSYDTKKPLNNVLVKDYLNNTQTTTNTKGYFYIKHNSQTLGELIFKKAGYHIDTFKTIRSFSGERFEETFKGDTIYMFEEHSKFRDSVSRLNGMVTK